MERVEIGTATLYHGDFIDVMPTLDDGSIACIASDPPYGVTSYSWDTAPPFEKMWELFELKSKDNANYILFGCGGFTIDLINSKRAWHRYNLCWCKNNKTGWLNSKLMVHRNHEDIMLFGKPGHQKSAVFNVPDGSVHPCSVLPFDHERGNGQQGLNFHPTQKPLRLMGYLLMLYSNPGNDIVLDPFMGSGTTGLAAMKLGRRFIGIEREEKFYRIACQRLQEVWRQKNARYKPRLPDPAIDNSISETTEFGDEQTTQEI